MTPFEAAWKRYQDAYIGPFPQQRPPDSEHVSELLDIVSEAIFARDTISFRVVGKDEVFQTFLEPYENEYGIQIVRTLEQADDALRFLVEQETVTVDGEWVSIHPRFADVLTRPLERACANKSPISAA
jgi:hypothetical protein